MKDKESISVKIDKEAVLKAEKEKQKSAEKGKVIKK